MTAQVPCSWLAFSTWTVEIYMYCAGRQ